MKSITRTIAAILVLAGAILLSGSKGSHDWLPGQSSFWSAGDWHDHWCVACCAFGMVMFALSNASRESAK